MEFAFEYKFNNGMRQSSYSKENQEYLFHYYNQAVSDTIMVFHEIRKGPKTGQVVMHEVNFVTRKITNKENGAVHRLVLMKPYTTLKQTKNQ